MNTSRFLGTVLFLGLSFSLGFCPAGLAANDVVAKVGQVPVTRMEVDREMQKRLPMGVGSHGQVSAEKQQAIRAKAKKAVIERAYMVQYALDAKLKVSNKEIDEIYEKSTQAYASKAEFKNALGDETPKEFRESIRRKLLADKALKAAVEGPSAVAEADLRSHYQGNPGIGHKPLQFQASLIQIQVPADASPEKKAELKKKAEDIAAKAKAGEDFYNLAYYNSDDRTKYVGGNIGSFPKGQLIPELETPLMKLKVGEVAGPIFSDFGYNIIKLTGREDERQLSFDEIKGNLEKQMRKQKRQHLYREWMEALNKKYPLVDLESAKK